ncbi:MAG TPA: aspartyl/asparaginyl beta-hydroxylase domain-containing protein [Pyrinomonadaceae bacterium]|nr:aspartyl/asparaginyl beta-hydroxylase domain-containing protein [Pyrinomonadaceae bacterium]
MLDLMEQVSQIARLDDRTLLAVRQEVVQLDEQWTNVYSEYHTGGWQTLSLLNSTSIPSDTVIEDCKPVETSLLQRMPQTRSLLRGLGFSYMWARLARLETDSFLIEHRDYQELKDARRLRLHIPLVVNPFSSLVINSTRVHLALGYIWKLNPMHRHGAGNFGKDARLHIILDCYVDEVLDALVSSETLDPICVYNLPPAADGEIDKVFHTATSLAAAGDFKAAEYHLLKLFHEYHLEEGFSFDLVIRMYDSIGDSEKSELWRRNKSRFLQPVETLVARD